ncbi:MAG: hypothetical protein DRP15_00435 [Candidatus Aenigmatarchaeota archaeon]|nr:MAG: hypothetical protein DRP15_00435 [Candidatus Aenigmarchaeota archaeon]
MKSLVKEMVNLWYIITLLGEPLYCSIGLTVSLLLYLMARFLGKRSDFIKRFFILAIPSLTVSLLTIFLIKTVCFIPRPCTPCIDVLNDCNPYCEDDSSFPSGHTATGFAIFTSLWFVRKSKKHLPLFFFPVAIALSRLALGVHTPVDVIVGGVIGFASAVVMDRLL